MVAGREVVKWGLAIAALATCWASASHLPPVGHVFPFSETERISASRRSPGWDDLILCSELTSIDSKKSLSLKSDFSAEVTDSSDAGGSKSSKGHWSLLNAEKHLYRIDTPGAIGNYVVVSPPDAEGCLLAEGGINYVDLRRSWFSVQIDPADLRDHP
jgi:hypothetical protein